MIMQYFIIFDIINMNIDDSNHGERNVLSSPYIMLVYLNMHFKNPLKKNPGYAPDIYSIIYNIPRSHNYIIQFKRSVVDYDEYGALEVAPI